MILLIAEPHSRERHLPDDANLQSIPTPPTRGQAGLQSRSTAAALCYRLIPDHNAVSVDIVPLNRRYIPTSDPLAINTTVRSSG
jgi:hypothetical protein